MQVAMMEAVTVVVVVTINLYVVSKIELIVKKYNWNIYWLRE